MRVHRSLGRHATAGGLGSGAHQASGVSRLHARGRYQLCLGAWREALATILRVVWQRCARCAISFSTAPERPHALTRLAAAQGHAEDAADLGRTPSDHGRQLWKRCALLQCLQLVDVAAVPESCRPYAPRWSIKAHAVTNPAWTGADTAARCDDCVNLCTAPTTQWSCCSEVLQPGMLV